MRVVTEVAQGLRVVLKDVLKLRYGIKAYVNPHRPVDEVAREELNKSGKLTPEMLQSMTTASIHRFGARNASVGISHQSVAFLVGGIFALLGAAIAALIAIKPVWLALLLVSPAFMLRNATTCMFKGTEPDESQLNPRHLEDEYVIMATQYIEGTVVGGQLSAEEAADRSMKQRNMLHLSRWMTEQGKGWVRKAIDEVLVIAATFAIVSTILSFF